MSIQQMFVCIGGDSESVVDWFSMDETTGNGGSNGTTQDVSNGIDLTNNEGLVISQYTSSGGYYCTWHDTLRGNWKNLLSLADGDENTPGLDSGIDAERDSNAWSSHPDRRQISFNNDGFTLGQDNYYGGVNSSGKTYAHWTFRQAPKFFDVVKYRGSGTARTKAHALGCDPGMIIYKQSSGVSGSTNGGEWVVWHKDMGATKYMGLNYRCEQQSTTNFNSTTPTSSVFSVNSDHTNKNNFDQMAYLFAADEDYIKCGQYTASYTESQPGPSVNLGWEPQFVMIKQKKLGSNETDNDDNTWWLFDKDRTGTYGGTTSPAGIRVTNGGGESAYPFISFTSTGFTIDPDGFGWGQVNASPNAEFIYMAIRKED